MESFNYVLTPKEKNRIAFGTTAERDVLPLRSIGGSKFISHFIREVNPKTDPTRYDSSNAFKKVHEKITSKRGVSGLIYTTPRFKGSLSTTPFLEYNLPSYPPEVRCNRYPFNSVMPRFPESGNTNPGVGYYDILLSGRRKLKFRHSFGGNKIIDTGTDIKCSPEILDTCHKCGFKPKGDYWHLYERTFLCRMCMEEEKETPTLFNIHTLNKFRRMRNCSFMHDHGGTKASISLINKHECQELAKNETYFALYFKSRRGYSLNEGPFPIVSWPLKRLNRPFENFKCLVSECIQPEENS